MGLVAFVVEERGRDPGVAALRVAPQTGPDEYSRAVDDLVSRKALDDPETAQMIAGHFAEVVLAKYLAGDEAAAHRAANALISVLGQPYLSIRANRLRGDIEILDIAKIDARSVDEAEEAWAAALERPSSTH
ncbi:hypothetical protein [Alsobacter sp. SYSU BS001988]|jgi:hypothetical protein